MRLRVAFLLVGLALLGLFIACSSDPEPGGVTPPDDAGADAATSEDAASNEDTGGGTKDARSDAPSSTGKTSVVAAINNVPRTLVRAQFGKSVADAAKETLYVEAHEGGDPACPTQASPSPKRTLIVSGIPRGSAGAKYTKADGIAVTLLDFTGDQLPNPPPLTKATAVTIAIVAIDVGAAPADGSSLVEFDLDATFAEGTAKGRIAATYCKSLDD